MRFGTWNVRSLYRAGSLTAVARELARYKLDLVGVQVRWDNGCTVRTGDCNFLYGKGNENHQLGTGLYSNHCAKNGYASTQTRRGYRNIILCRYASDSFTKKTQIV